MNLRSAYAFGQEVLTKAEIEDASNDAWLLLEYVTGVSRAVYFADADREMSQEQVASYRALLEKRANHIPLQHLTGEQEFMGLSFHVNEYVLVPRQDTEVLVEMALSMLRPDMRVLDMCTGSGCILLSLMKLGNVSEGVGVDVSEEALNVARTNAKDLDVPANFILSNLFEQVEGTFDIIVSNPPYIPTEVIRGLQKEVRLHDPMLALDGKEDGLYFYREIISACRDYLREGGSVLFEIGHDQGDAVSKLMNDAGFTQVQVKKDLAGLDRVVAGVYNTKGME